MQALLPARSFLALSWKRYTEHLGRFLEVSLWMLIPFLFQIALLFGLTIPSVSFELETVWTWNLIISRVLQLVLLTWVQVRLIKLALAQNPKEEGRIATHPHIGWNLVAPLLWINILVGIAILGGGMTFVVPGIWLFFSLMFAGFVLVEQQLRGLQALDASFALVRRRWWPVVGRSILAGASFLGIMLLVTFCFSLIFGFTFGGDAQQTLGQLTRSLILDGIVSVDSLRAYSITQLQNALVGSIATPFLIASQAVLYRSLVDTYEPATE